MLRSLDFETLSFELLFVAHSLVSWSSCCRTRGSDDKAHEKLIISYACEHCSLECEVHVAGLSRPVLLQKVKQYQLYRPHIYI